MTRVILSVTLAASFGSFAQSPSTSFEVASVKPVVPPLPTGGGPWTVSHGRFKAEVAVLRSVIGWANGVPGVQVHGGPEWVDREAYRFDAKAENAEAGPDQIKMMLETLLEDRFKLSVHRETREGRIYTLIVGKNGPKMEEAKSEGMPFGNWTGPGKATFTHMNLLGLVNVLSSMLEAPVVDKSGLKSFYNFKLEYEDPRFQRAQTGTQPPADSGPNIFTAVEEQLGLKLEASKGPMEVLVIDHIERPSAN